jgi:ABC-type uncharacterized transport system substrate-binding protein
MRCQSYLPLPIVRAFDHRFRQRLGLLHGLVPKAARVAALVNPADATAAEATLRDVQEAARVLGLQIHVLNAGTSREIDAAFATLARSAIWRISTRRCAACCWN